MKFNKLGAIGLMGTIGSGVVCAGISEMFFDNNGDSQDYIKPLNRDGSYECFSLKKYFSNDDFLEKMVKTTIKNNGYFKTINKEYFTRAFKENFTKILDSISRFKNKSKEYNVDLHFSFKNEKTLFLDVVWNLPGAKYYFYDQLKIYLS